MTTASQKVTITEAADGTITASRASAELIDIVSTTFSSNDALTGAYGLVQKVVLFGAGMSFQNYRLGRGWNPFA